MLFNSIDFALFLPLVFLLYWFVFQRDLRLQNALVLVASYVFYGWWDHRFLALIVFSTLVDYIVGQGLGREGSPARRKALLLTSVVVNLGFLGFFKYYNFFLDNFTTAFTFFGGQINASSLKIILPVGISFYTFQTLSYTIDIYRGKLKPTKDILAFSAFIAFFPQLVAGPIERASNLLPQFYTARSFNYRDAVDGLRQILWGLFKKIVIADNCAVYANIIFNDSGDHSGSTLALGAIFFAFQIYGDFSGYSDIAIGTSRLFGFNLMKNFAFPYFSRDIAEFWRRWHISLSTWFRDYLYIPLGGSRGGLSTKVRNVFIIFLVSGFWHGANWTFIAWGALNALYFLPLFISNRNRSNLEIVAQNTAFPSLREVLSMGGTFALTTLAWVLFRAKDIGHAMEYYQGIFSKSLFSIPTILPIGILILLLIFLIIEWQGRRKDHPFKDLELGMNRSARHVLYYACIAAIFWFGGEEQQFIYFQF